MKIFYNLNVQFEWFLLELKVEISISISIKQIGLFTNKVEFILILKVKMNETKHFKIFSTTRLLSQIK